MEKRMLYDTQLRLEGCGLHVLLDRSMLCTYPVRMQMHNHAAFEVHAVRSGRHLFQIEQQELVLSPGEFCIICPGVYHTKRSAEGEAASAFSFKFECLPEKGEAGALGRRLRELRGCLPGGCTPMLFGCVDEIAAEFAGGGLGREERMDALLTLLMVELLRAALEESGTELRETPPVPDYITFIVDEFFAIRYREEVTVETLAGALCVSVRQVNRILNRLYGQSFHSKLVEARISSAKLRLRDTGETVQHIAHEVGYGNVRYFIKAFRELTGVTPSRFREQSREERNTGSGGGDA